MSEARAVLRFGEEAGEGEVSGGVVGPPAGSGRTASLATGASGWKAREGRAVDEKGGMDRGKEGGRLAGCVRCRGAWPVCPGCAAAVGGLAAGGLWHGTAAAAQAAALAAAPPPAAAAVPLQHALPASLAHDPLRVRAMHEAFFGGGGGGGGGGGAIAPRAGAAAGALGFLGAPLPPAPRPGAGGGELAPAASLLSGALPREREHERERAGEGRAGGGGGGAPASNAWRRAASALTAAAPGELGVAGPQCPSRVRAAVRRARACCTRALATAAARRCRRSVSELPASPPPPSAQPR
jgi:hypothetical protein